MAKRIYVGVTAYFKPDGTFYPISLSWADGRVYPVDKILDMRRAASLKAGGVGLRFTCRILGQQRFLFYDDTHYRWFVEGKD